MKPYQYITRQLKEQSIAFKVLQDKYIDNQGSLVVDVVKRWKSKFVASRSAPALDVYLWHIFSFDVTKASEGKQATEDYYDQWPAKTLIFNEPQQYLIECASAIPKIEMEDFMDDIYICHHNMKWTYVLPHELPSMGPYFSLG